MIDPYIPLKWRIQYRIKGSNIFLYMIKDLFIHNRNDVKSWFLSSQTKKHKYYYGSDKISFLLGDKKNLEFINAKYLNNHGFKKSVYKKLHISSIRS